MEIKIIDNSKYIPTLDPKYVVLGFLDEYMGHRIHPGSDWVESFYPHENENHLVKEFCDWFTAWGNNEEKKISLEIKYSEQGHVSISSEEAANLLNKCYSYRLDKTRIYQDNQGNGYHTEIAYVSEQMFPKLKGYAFLPEIVDSRFSFLFGCYRRYGTGNEFCFANASHKVDLVLEFLEQLRCEWLQKEWHTNTAPRVSRIRFSPTIHLAKLFGIKDSVE